MTRFLIYANLATRRLASSSGSPITLPPLVAEDKYAFALRLLDNSETGSLQQINLPVRNLRASIGNVMTAPTKGTFTLKIGSSGAQTATIAHNEQQATLMQKIAALSAVSGYGGVSSVIQTTDSTWLITFGNDAEVPLQVGVNNLDPIAFVRVRSYLQNSKRVHELRLIQAPLARTDSKERILGDAPSIRRIVEGTSFTEGLTEYKVNEVQALTVPPGYTGTYALKFSGRMTPYLSSASTLEEIQVALSNLVAPPDTEAFSVTSPERNNAYIEFKSIDFSGQAQPLLEVIPGSPGVGELTFYIDLKTAELQSALRNQASVTIPFEVRLEVGPDGENETTPDFNIPSKPITLFRENITIIRGMNFAEAEVIEPINYLKPPQPVDYVPFSRDQIVTGNQVYAIAIGDGESTTFQVTHGLGTRNLIPLLRHNDAQGQVLVLGTDYTLKIDNDNSITIQYLSETAPAEAALYLVISSAATASSFAAHHHEIADVNGLSDALSALQNRIVNLEELVPSIPLAARSTTKTSTSIPFRDFSSVLFLPAGYSSAITEKGLDEAQLPARAPFLLSAVHNAAAATLTNPLPSPSRFGLWVNDSEEKIVIPGGGGIKGSKVDAGGYVGSDGRILYPVTRSGTSTSYYPKPFERLLWNVFIDEAMYNTSRALQVRFGVVTQLGHATSQSQWVLVIEKGSAPQETLGDPNTNDLNLLNVVWDTANPILKQRIILNEIPMVGEYGCNIYLKKDGTTQCDAFVFGSLRGANAAAPQSWSFALRARLVDFDTENNDTTAKGWVMYQVIKPPTTPTAFGVTFV